MNIFSGSKAVFRRGQHSKDTLLSATENEDRAVLKTANTHAQPTVSHGTTSHSALVSSSSSNALPQGTRSVPSRLGQGDQLQEQTMEDEVHREEGHWRCFPSVPYYAVAKALELRVDVYARPPVSRNHGGTSVLHHKRGRNQLLQGESSILWLQSELSGLTQQCARFYYLSTADASEDAALAGRHQVSTAAALKSKPVSRLLYSIYLEALASTFSAMLSLRSLYSHTSDHSISTHHTVYLRISGHPTWRDLCALLCVERGRLVLYVSCSSRITQRHLSAQCTQCGGGSVELAWLAGAACVSEPVSLQTGEVNPVWAAWDALVNLPLINTSAGTHDPQFAPSALSGFHVSVLSSLPFLHCVTHTPVLRLTDDAALMERTQGDTKSLQCVGRRYTWKLIEPCYTVAHPFFISQLVQFLVVNCEDVDLRSFEICFPHASSNKSGSTSGGVGSFQQRFNTTVGAGAPAAAAASSSFLSSARTMGTRAPLVTDETTTTTTAAAAVAGLGALTFVRSVYHSGASTLLRAPSSQTWQGFSRLSCSEWIIDEERRRLGLYDVDEDGDEVELECEFMLTALRYQRPSRDEHKSKCGRSDSDGLSTGYCSTGRAMSKDLVRNGERPLKTRRLNGFEIQMERKGEMVCDDGVCPASWGAGFQWYTQVLRVMTVFDNDNNDEVEGIEGDATGE